MYQSNVWEKLPRLGQIEVSTRLKPVSIDRNTFTRVGFEIFLHIINNAKFD